MDEIYHDKFEPEIMGKGDSREIQTNHAEVASS